MLELFFSACGAGVCVVLMMLIVKDFFHSMAARAFFVLIFGAFVYLCHDWLPDDLHVYAYMVESITPAFFWISCRLIFQEGKSLPKIGWVLALYSATTPVIKYSIIVFLETTPGWVEFWGREVQQYCEYALIIMGVFALLRGRKDDLVEARRRLRWAIMGAAGLSLGWSIFSFNLNLGSDASRILAIDLSLLIIIWFLMKGRSDIFVGVNNTQASPLSLSKEPSLGDRVCNLNTSELVLSGAVNASSVMSEKPQSSSELLLLKAVMAEGFYRRENLTLKDLALEMSLPEYRIRAVINKELNYRNFNEFINEYRITEAAQRLATEPDTPISNIALDIGYRTLSSFNRAFRKEKNTTPTAYRDSL